MLEIGANEANNHLPELLNRVEKGESFLITRNGHAVAELTPAANIEGDAIRKTVEEMRRFREGLRQRGVRLGDLLQEGQSLRDLAHDGHSY
ncbi:MAG: type II toxin-antitoxin system prevent-host-death family antitoxin [Proteobacteria bacterium]|nr:type II toxin-antitoxin system prevent-host-death family antitoxin [Pseudomonadota bacterium]